MISGIYRAVWLDAVDRDGNKLRALTFVVVPQHKQYAGELPLEQRAHYIAFAQGRIGCCRDYLAETVMQLREMGAQDAYIDALVAEVRRCRREPHWPDPHPAGTGDQAGPGREES